MAKKESIAGSTTMLRLKEEYLRAHLDDVRATANSWLGQLVAPTPFEWNGRAWGWSVAYRPDVEKDPDSNAVLRGHLRSRALWRHHADWTRKLDTAIVEYQSIKAQAMKMMDEPVPGDGPALTAAADFLGSALSIAFDRTKGVGGMVEYQSAPGAGVRYGAYLIDYSASGKQVESVTKDHRALIDSFASRPAKTEAARAMRKMADLWRQVEEHQASMQALVGKELKASDILYPCRFCRRLWQG